jgi:hypothetical protein
MWHRIHRSFFYLEAVFLVSMLFTMASAQSPVTLYADTAANIYLQDNIKILQREINRSTPVIFNIEQEDQFRGNGFLLSAKPVKWPEFNKGLNKNGIESSIVKSTKKGVVIIGNSDQAIRNGVFIYLEAVGFRYYFPHPDWYIVPERIRNLYPSINYSGTPSFDHRRIWYGYGSVGSKMADENYRFWFMANKLGGSMDAVVGHAYDDIVEKNKEVFKLHPEWLYPVPAKGTIPGNPKFDLTNESLIQFVIADVFKRLDEAKKRNVTLKMITMNPSDGVGTCNTSACQQLGTVTDRVYSLINRVAREVRLKYPGTWVSGMAYSEYAEPPTRKLEPNTFVSIATAFNYTRYNTDELINLWGKKAGKVGVYDYLGLFAWDFDLPGKGLANRVTSVIENIRKYYRLGARGYDAESTPGSINKGLGHYIASKLLWDVNTDPESIKKEFFEKCFGRAALLLRKLWDEWEAYPYTVVRESDLASWLDIITQASGIESGEPVKKRLTHIKVYLHYLYLYNNFRKSESESSRIELLNYSYNTFDWAAFSGYPALWELGNGTGIEGFGFNDPHAKYKKIDSQFRNPDYIDLITAGDRKLLKLKEAVKPYSLPARFQSKISIPSIFKDKQYAAFKGSTTFTGPHSFVIEIKQPGNTNFIDFSGGYSGGNNMSISIVVSPYENSLKSGSDILLKYDYNGRMDTQRISLKNLKKGYFLVVVSDPQKYFKISFSSSISYALLVTPQARLNGYTKFMSFYVPKGTSRFRIFKDIETTLVSPAGRKLDFSKKATEEIDITVVPGEEGFWLINFSNGKVHIEGVPPVMGMDPEQMLVPQ